jgi:hypothetical protein
MRTLLALPALTLLATAIGCSPIYYPNAPYTTLPVEAGELGGAVRASTSGIEAQVAVAPLKSLVVAGSASFLYVPGDVRYITHRYGELAVGWSDTSGRATFSALLGAGLGSTATPPGSRFPWDNQTYDSARYGRVFAQASIGSLRYARSIEPGERSNSGFALGLRLAWVRASSLWIDEKLQPPASDLFVEPFASWQSRGEQLGFEVDFGVSMPPRGGTRFHQSPLRLGVGLTYSLF